MAFSEIYMQCSIMFIYCRLRDQRDDISDVVNVHDGSSIYENTLSHLSGYLRNKVHSAVQSTNSDIFINFISGIHEKANGFRIQYDAYGRT